MVPIYATPPNEYLAWLHMASLILHKALCFSLDLLIIYIIVIASIGISSFIFSWLSTMVTWGMFIKSHQFNQQCTVMYNSQQVVIQCNPIHNQLLLGELLWSSECVGNLTCPCQMTHYAWAKIRENGVVPMNLGDRNILQTWSGTGLLALFSYV